MDIVSEARIVQNVPWLILQADVGPYFLWEKIYSSENDVEISSIDEWRESCPVSHALWGVLSDWARGYALNFFSQDDDGVYCKQRWDWGGFNAEGVRLAQLLKGEVGVAYRVIYSDPPDSPWGLRRHEVFEDGSVVEIPDDHPWCEAEPFRFVRKILCDGVSGIGRAAYSFALRFGYPSKYRDVRGKDFSIWSIASDSPQQSLEFAVLESDGVACFSVGSSASRRSEIEALAARHSRSFIHIDLDDQEPEGGVQAFERWIHQSKIRTLLVTSGGDAAGDEGWEGVYDFLKTVHERHDLVYRSVLPPSVVDYYGSLRFAFLDDQLGPDLGFQLSLGRYPYSRVRDGLLIDGAIITAEDSFQEEWSGERNAAATRSLLKWLEGWSLTYGRIREGDVVADLNVPNEAVDSSKWFFVWGMTEDMIRKFCVEFRQHAGFLVSNHEPVCLVIHPDFKI